MVVQAGDIERLDIEGVGARARAHQALAQQQILLVVLARVRVAARLSPPLPPLMPSSKLSISSSSYAPPGTTHRISTTVTRTVSRRVARSEGARPNVGEGRFCGDWGGRASSTDGKWWRAVRVGGEAWRCQFGEERTAARSATGRR